jgi:energy-coupling factor transport system ATP-binding protein
MPLISFESVSYAYEDSAPLALDSITLDIDAGEYVAVVGANGSGKSTFLRLLNSLKRATSGTVLVAGMDASVPANARDIRSTVSLVFQSPPDQIVASVVEEDVAFGPENLGLSRAEIESRVTEALEAVGLVDERRRPPHFLSAGQQQRLAVAGAIAMKGRCLAFDEATAMLDPPSREAILSLMDKLVAQGVAVVHVTHDMSEAVRAKRLVALDAGRIVFDGESEEFFRSICEEARGGLSCLVAPPALRLARSLGVAGSARETAAAMAARLASLLAGSSSAAAQAEPADPMAAGRSSPDSAARVPTGPSEPMAAGPIAAADALRDTLPAPDPRGAAAGEGAAGISASAGRGAAFDLAGVSYSYLRGTVNQSPALDGVTMSVPRGSVIALVGRTGSGKSTLLQLLDALAFPSKGRVLSFGDETAAPGTDLRRLRTRAPLAVQRPEAALFEPYAGDDVAFGPRNLGLSGRDLVARARSAMERAGLSFEEFRDRRTRSLSGGEKRMLALAGVLALEPEALLLDEPTAALDPAAKERVLDLVSGLVRAGTTIVMATHSMEEAARADLVAVIVAGRLAAFGPPRRVFYEDYDSAWGIGRPFACEFARAFRAAGVDFPHEPLTLDRLAELLRSFTVNIPASAHAAAEGGA